MGNRGDEFQPGISLREAVNGYRPDLQDGQDTS